MKNFELFYFFRTDKSRLVPTFNFTKTKVPFNIDLVERGLKLA